MATLDRDGRAALPWWPCVPRRRRPRRAHRDVAAARPPAGPRAPIDRAAAGETAPLAVIADRACARSASTAVAPNGVLGDPAGASAAEGHELLDRLADDLGAASTAGGRRDRLDRGRGVTTYALDASTHRPTGSDVVIGGSPLRLFRLTPAGIRCLRAIAAGAGHRRPRPRRDRLDRPPRRRRRDPPAARGGGRSRPPTSPSSCPPSCSASPRSPRSCAAAPGVAAVIAVDDASDPPVAAVAGSRVLRLRTNAGPAVARNAGLGAVDTPLVAFVDTDVRLRTGLARPSARPLRRRARRPRRARGSPALPAPDRSPRYEQGHSPLDLGPEPGTHRAGDPPQLRARRRRSSCGPTRCARIDGFDRQLRFGEDVDAVWRLVEAGWRCRYEPASVVHHRPRGSWRALVAQRVAYGSSAAPLAKRHPGALAPVRISGWSGGGVGAARGRPSRSPPSPSPAAPRWRSSASCPASRRPSRCASPALGHLYAGRLLADAGRRAWWPLLLAGALVSKRVRRVGAAAAVPALLERRHPAARRRPRLRRRAVEGRAGRRETGPVAAPLHVVARPTVAAAGLTAAGCTVAGVTLRLTVDTDDWRAHVERTSPAATPASCRS